MLPTNNITVDENGLRMGLYIDGLFDPDEEHTAYQWVSHGYVPKPDARFYPVVKEHGRYGEESDIWYYCTRASVTEDKAEARRLMRSAPRKRDNHTEGGWYDGHPWW